MPNPFLVCSSKYGAILVVGHLWSVCNLLHVLSWAVLEDAVVNLARSVESGRLTMPLARLHLTFFSVTPGCSDYADTFRLTFKERSLVFDAEPNRLSKSRRVTSLIDLSVIIAAHSFNYNWSVLMTLICPTFIALCLEHWLKVIYDIDGRIVNRLPQFWEETAPFKVSICLSESGAVNSRVFDSQNALSFCGRFE